MWFELPRQETCRGQTFPDSVCIFGRGVVETDLGKSVGNIPNVFLEEETGDLVGGERYEHTAERETCCAGHYERRLATMFSEITNRILELNGMRLAIAVIERRRGREADIEETMIEIYLPDVSTKCSEDVSEIPRGPSMSTATGLDLNEGPVRLSRSDATAPSGTSTTASTSTEPT